MKTTIDYIYNWLKLSGYEFGDTSKIQLALDLIDEEVGELIEDAFNFNKIGVMDGQGDLFWVVCNLTYFMGIPSDQIADYFKKIKESNYSKFCKTEEEAHKTVYAYKNGTHPNKQGEKIDTNFEKVGESFVIKRISDGKILKSVNYVDIKRNN